MITKSAATFFFGLALAGAAKAADDKPLLGPLNITPADQAGTEQPRVEGRVSYLSGTLDTTETDSFGTDKSAVKITGPYVAAAGVVPVGPVTIGLQAGYAPLVYKSTDTHTSKTPTTSAAPAFDFEFDATIASASPLVAVQLGNHLALGFRYNYETVKIKFKFSTGFPSSDDTSVVWGESATLGLALELPSTTLGIAYQTREWRLGPAPVATLYGEQRVGSAISIGAVFASRLQQFQRYDDGAEREDATIDALGTLGLAIGKHHRLSFLAGYLPKTSAGFDDLGHLGLTRTYGSGFRLGGEFELGLSHAVALGFGLDFDDLGRKAGREASAKDVTISTRIAAKI